MRVTIPDQLADAYTAHATAANASLDRTVEAQLERTVGVSPFGRSLILGQSTLETLEQRLGGGPLTSSAQLAARFDRLASIAFEGIDLLFTVNQLAELERRAARQGKTVKQLAQEIAAAIMRDFFDVSEAPIATVRVAAEPHPPIPGLAGAPR